MKYTPRSDVPRPGFGIRKDARWHELTSAELAKLPAFETMAVDLGGLRVVATKMRGSSEGLLHSRRFPLSWLHGWELSPDVILRRAER